MITVQVLINGQVLFCRSASNISDDKHYKKKGEIHKYKCDDGRIIEHRPSEGVIPLCKKMLDTIQE